MGRGTAPRTSPALGRSGRPPATPRRARPPSRSTRDGRTRRSTLRGRARQSTRDARTRRLTGDGRTPTVSAGPPTGSARSVLTGLRAAARAEGAVFETVEQLRDVPVDRLRPRPLQIGARNAARQEGHRADPGPGRRLHVPHRVAHEHRVAGIDARQTAGQLHRLRGLPCSTSSELAVARIASSASIARRSAASSAPPAEVARTTRQPRPSSVRSRSPAPRKAGMRSKYVP